ncbi:MAG: TetR/AcrR family transcriptional regulator [Chloroflexi bacterium]|nr:TetR/AcrR family transcriptional regulator [Chloroflexota bacterium]
MPADNRSNLLVQALQLFADRGYDAVGVQQIVQAAGVTKPTLYHYFGSKRGLLDAILDEHYNRLLEKLRAAATYQGDLPLTLTRVARAYFDFARENQTFFRLQLAMCYGPLHSEPYQAVMRGSDEQQSLIEGLFIQAAEDHGNMRERHKRYAITFLGMLNTYVGMALRGLTDLDEELTREAVHQFQHGIYS